MTSAKIIFLITSSIIGAGFISGKEIFIYFSSFGICGLIMIIPLYFILYFYIKILLDFSHLNKTQAFNSYVFSKPKTYNFFCFVTFSIISATMFAAINSVFNFDLFSIEYIVLYIIVFVLCVNIMHLGFEKFATINTYIIPIIILVFIITILSTPFNGVFNKANNNLINAPFSLVVYGCGNMFLSHYIILDCSKNLNKKQIKTISFYCSFIICFMIAMCVLVELFHPEICQFDIPLLYIAKNISYEFYIIYYLVVVYCILSTLFSSLYSLKAFYKFKNKGANIIAPVLISFFISLFGFSNFIKYLYPVIGFFGFYMFFKLLHFNKRL